MEHAQLDDNWRSQTISRFDPRYGRSAARIPGTRAVADDNYKTVRGRLRKLVREWHPGLLESDDLAVGKKWYPAPQVVERLTGLVHLRTYLRPTPG